MSTPSNDKETTSLGNIDFKVTSSTEAVKAFEKGVLLLHSFMYSDAADEFRTAQEIDPDFAMAYWGEAMTYNHPLWSEQDYEKANEALGRLGETTQERIEKAPSEFEKDIFRSAEIMYGEGSKIERDDAYAEYLGTLSEKYPENHEISAFYALSLLGSVEEGRDYNVYEKGAKIAEGVLEENPSHPGALHYLIHSYDDPDHASLALEAANSYSEVAPDAGHALHMPSHIYISMGMWDEVIASNIRSYEARLKRIEDGRSYGWNLHAYQWLLYGYLQKNDTENVQEIMERMNAYAGTEGGNVYTKSYLIDMVGIFLAETNQWNSDIPFIDFDTEGLNVRFEVSRDFIGGYKSFVNEDEFELKNTIQTINAKIESAENRLITRGISVCSSGGFASRPPVQNDIDIAKVLELQLNIGLAQLQGKEDKEIEGNDEAGNSSRK